MARALLDTSIFVDVLRKYAPALTWMGTQRELGVPIHVWFEVLDGVLNRAEERRAVSLLSRFERIEIAAEDYEWALKNVLDYRLSHGIDTSDCLIAAPAYRLQVPLYTQNLKHFRPILGQLALKPY